MLKSKTKTSRAKKKQMGQFMTPTTISAEICSQYKFTKNDKVLEPSFGNGSFLLEILRKFVELYSSLGFSIEDSVKEALTKNIYGVELDKDLYESCLTNITNLYGRIEYQHNLVCKDFFLYETDVRFSHIIGNPPFGGTINPKYQDAIDKRYGKRFGRKIKKETYSIFTVKCVELLLPTGKLNFICSDTFLTINTMSGLRNFLMTHGNASVDTLKYFSEETSYGMVNFTIQKSSVLKNEICIDGNQITYKQIESTPNLSWKITTDLSKYFSEKSLSSFVICSSGMTTGNNELFVREIKENSVTENVKFDIEDKIMTMKEEIELARLGKLSSSQIQYIKSGKTKRVLITHSIPPKSITIPDADYKYYNKSTNEILYSKPKWVIYWKNNGEAVITFKKSGHWYLHGIGGKKYFEKEGITWSLRGDKIYARHLPKGYILDSGAPIAVLKPKIHKNEHYFILGWLLTDLCSKILKSVINHTQNIQGKDVERLPYPFWVNNKNKSEIIEIVKDSINKKIVDSDTDVSVVLSRIETLFSYSDSNNPKSTEADSFFV